ncbi:hypothetical protein J6590_063413 [Homalodisca vitripennis]|nr:hypothetical protein J6590_063413 [Homalodisca vitripennis]
MEVRREEVSLSLKEDEGEAVEVLLRHEKVEDVPGFSDGLGVESAFALYFVSMDDEPEGLDMMVAVAS